MISHEEIRLFLNDIPETNELNGNKCEFSPERIQNAIKLVLADWNETPPLTETYNEKSFPYRNAMLYGVCYFLFVGEAASQARNHLTYSDGGLQVDDNNRFSPYMQLATYFKNEYTTLKISHKKNENTVMGWGTVPSNFYSRRFN